MTTYNFRAKSFSLVDTSIFFELLRLMKPRVMSLVIFTCAVGLLTASGEMSFIKSITNIFFVTLGAGAAGALNMWYEADLDKLMSRTCLRPLPTGKLKKKHALIFGIVLSIVSVSGLYYFSNLLSALILLFTISFYLFVYTIWLKRRTPQNIVIGGASGALPPVIGWTIVTNSLGLEPLSFFLIIFFWTPSHFWALSLYKVKDYKKAKIPMLPVTNGIEETKKNIFIYSLIMFPTLLLPYLIGFVGELFLVSTFGLTIYYVLLCFDLFKTKKNSFDLQKAKKVFGYSIFYLFLIFVLFLIDKLF
tara:strand:+ start:89 stop:1000 length:912 start_codon:yes stop_codon:yes gene_type:complete